MIKRLKEGGEIIRQKMDQLEQLLQQPEPPSRSILTKARWEASSVVLEFMFGNIKNVYAKLLDNEYEEVANIAKKAISDMNSNYHNMIVNNSQWPIGKIEQDWHNYTQITVNFINWIRSTLDFERDHIIPIIRKYQLKMPEPADPNDARSRVSK